MPETTPPSIPTNSATGPRDERLACSWSPRWRNQRTPLGLQNNKPFPTALSIIPILYGHKGQSLAIQPFAPCMLPAQHLLHLALIASSKSIILGGEASPSSCASARAASAVRL